MTDIPELVSAIRKQNWKNGGALVMDDDEAEELIERALSTLESRLQEAERRAEDALKCLRDHHQWHLDAGEIGLSDGEGGWVEINDAAEYCDSLLYERTQKALQGFPADDAGPMPRGGVSAWWWAQGVLERRKRRAAERQLSELRAENERLRADLDAARGEEPLVRPAIQADLVQALDSADEFLGEYRARVEKAESERDTLALQVEGLRNIVSKEASLLDSHSWTINDGIVGDVAKRLEQALSSTSPSPLLAYVEAGKAAAEETRAEDYLVRTYRADAYLWEVRLEAARSARRKACAPIIEKEKGDDA